VKGVRIELVTGEPGERRTSEVWHLYDPIFGDQPDESTWRQGVWDRHVARDGFRLVIAYDAAEPVGFGYGYTGTHGQWWTDRAAEVLADEVGTAWLGGHFELVSIGVVPEARGRGIGGALLERLTADLTHDRWVLMTTADPEDPARRLYARQGWEVVGPGLSPDRVIMGRRRDPLAVVNDPGLTHGDRQDRA
jgi:ribosomal protein S18 acetylase RimI-like enzyme